MKKIYVVLLAVLTFLTFIPGTAMAAEAVPQQVLDVRDSLVRILGTDGESNWSGTGFAIGEESPVSYIVTNYHIADSEDAYLQVHQSETIYTKATIYKAIPSADLCILELEGPIYDIPPVTLEDVLTPAAGEAIYALGYPGAADSITRDLAFGADEVTVTDGIISALKTGSLPNRSTTVEMVQFNAAVSGGNSGGPLVNENGNVIGVNTLASPYADNISVAISIDELIPALDSSGIAYKKPVEIAKDEETQESADWTGVSSTTGAQQKGADSTGWIIAIGCVLLVAAGVIIFLLLWRRKKPKLTQPAVKRARGVSFGIYFADAAKRLDDKLYALLTLITQVQTLHRQGKFNIDICPDNITVINNQATLDIESLSENSQSARTIRPGYSALEQYHTNQMKGPWSDVYALSAVLYHVITGLTLPSAFERSNGALFFPEGLDDKYTGLTQAITKGLSNDYQQRILSVDELSVQVQTCLIGYQPQAFVQPAVMHAQPQNTNAVQPQQGVVLPQNTNMMQPQYTAVTVSPQPRGVNKRWTKKKKAIVIFSACAAVIVIAFGTLLIVTESKYAQASAYADNKEYEQAQKSLIGVFASYKDSDQLVRYIKAGKYIDDGNYTKAKEHLEGLENFKDAHELSCEADYMQAMDWLEQGQLAKAESAFDALIDLGYDNAEEMLVEIAYLRAKGYLDEKNWDGAMEALAALGDYKDTSDLLEQTKEGIYQDAIAMIEEKGIEDAIVLFQKIPNYKETARFEQAHRLLSKDFEYFTEKDYEQLVGFDDIMSIAPYVLEDGIIDYFLDGRWEEDSGYYFDFDDQLGASYNLPSYDGTLYGIEDTIYTSYDDVYDYTGIKEFRFTCIDIDTIEVYCYKNGEEVTLHRQ